MVVDLFKKDQEPLPSEMPLDLLRQQLGPDTIIFFMQPAADLRRLGRGYLSQYLTQNKFQMVGVVGVMWLIQVADVYLDLDMKRGRQGGMVVHCPSKTSHQRVVHIFIAPFDLKDPHQVEPPFLLGMIPAAQFFLLERRRRWLLWQDAVEDDTVDALLEENLAVQLKQRAGPDVPSPRWCSQLVDVAVVVVVVEGGQSLAFLRRHGDAVPES
jgi:hypothetical protein